MLTGQEFKDASSCHQSQRPRRPCLSAGNCTIPKRGGFYRERGSRIPLTSTFVTTRGDETHVCRVCRSGLPPLRSFSGVSSAQADLISGPVACSSRPLFETPDDLSQTLLFTHGFSLPRPSAGRPFRVNWNHLLGWGLSEMVEKHEARGRKAIGNWYVTRQTDRQTLASRDNWYLL